MTELQQRILDVFKYTVSQIKKYNLRYVACGGTLLGAVRHKGFIPWDDDIDIYMPREDYNKFIALSDEMQRDGFDIYSVEHNKGYVCAWAKVVDINTSLWEVEYRQFMTGVFVDIFPLDEFNCSKDEIRVIQSKSRQLFENYVVAGDKYDNTEIFKFLFNFIFLIHIIFFFYSFI